MKSPAPRPSHLIFVGRFGAGHGAEQSGLAAPVRTHDGESFSTIELEGQLLKHRLVAEALRELLGLEQDDVPLVEQKPGERGPIPPSPWELTDRTGAISAVEAELRQNCVETVLTGPSPLRNSTCSSSRAWRARECSSSSPAGLDASVAFIASSSVCRAWIAANIIFSSSSIDRSPVSSENCQK